MTLKKNNRGARDKWPFPGSSASFLFDSEYEIVISSDLIRSQGFNRFYQEWIGKIDRDINKKITLSLYGINTNTKAVEYKGIKISLSDYQTLFSFLEDGNHGIIFITGNSDTMEQVISASRSKRLPVRIYSLDDDGRLQSVEIPKPKGHQKQSKVFSISNEINEFRYVTRVERKVPQTGDVVYDSFKNPFELGEEFLSNAQSITYYTNKDNIQAKIYQLKWLTVSYYEDKIKRMLEISVISDGICWPKDCLYNKSGEFVGYITCSADGVQLKQDILNQQGIEENFPNWNRLDIIKLAQTILDKVIVLQELNVFFGVLNLNSILVRDSQTVFFTEMDTYQIEGYPVLTFERELLAPELQSAEKSFFLYTKQQDNYEIALLLFMILMVGKFPYIKGKNKTVSESIRKMNFAFRYKSNGEEHGAHESYGLWRFVWSHIGKDLKQAFFDTFQYGRGLSKPENRRNARFWKRKLDLLEQELQNPYDKESLQIFPKTFKRYEYTRTIKCEKCGIEHPDFYFSFKGKNICNSCLAKPSDTHFRCKSCEKDFYYDFKTLFKYEKLVKEKNFNMPTHCPYCRSDKKVCVQCGSLVPAYRLNEYGMCIDCANEIVKTYTGECGHTITLTRRDVSFYLDKFGNLPKRCKKCRKNRTIRF